MNLAAAIAYLRHIRSARGLSQAGLGQALRDRLGLETPSDRTIRRWEGLGGEPSISELAAFIQVVGGSIVDVHRLLISPQMTQAHATDMAQRWIDQADGSFVQNGSGEPVEPDIRQLLELARTAQQKGKMEELVSFGLYLIESSAGT